jgi:uncharacterized membrane protein YfcA
MAATSLHAGPLWWTAISLLGLVVGFVGGMFGVGGNFLLIPLLHVVFGVPLEIAVGTSLCQIIGTGVAALRRHQRLRQGEIKIDWIMLAGGLVGAETGARLLSHLAALGTLVLLGHPITAVKLILSLTYIVVLFTVALWMLHDARVRPANAPLRPGPLTRIPIPPITHLPNSDRDVSVLALACLGLLMGFLSGLVGMGGGVVLMPILIYGLGMRVRMAAGTGILVLVASAVAGTIAHARMGNVHLGLAMTLLAGSTLGAPLGATLTYHMDGRRLRGLFAYLVLVTAAAVLWDLLRILLTR